MTATRKMTAVMKMTETMTAVMKMKSATQVTTQLLSLSLFSFIFEREIFGLSKDRSVYFSTGQESTTQYFYRKCGTYARALQTLAHGNSNNQNN